MALKQSRTIIFRSFNDSICSLIQDIIPNFFDKQLKPRVYLNTKYKVDHFAKQYMDCKSYYLS